MFELLEQLAREVQPKEDNFIWPQFPSHIGTFVEGSRTVHRRRTTQEYVERYITLNKLVP